MKNPHKGYLVNHHQANVAEDGKARVHRLMKEQPPKCQIEKIDEEHGTLFETENECRDYCQQNGIDYKGCEHCFPGFR